MTSPEPSPPPADSASALIRRLQSLYCGLSVQSISQLDEVYTQDIEFVDPSHHIQGSLGLKNYLRRQVRSLRHFQMHYTDTLLGPESAYLSWELEYAHAGIAGGRTIPVRGVSHLKFTHKVYYHEDVYDLGLSLYEHVPVLGSVVKLVKHNMTGKE